MEFVPECSELMEAGSDLAYHLIQHLSSWRHLAYFLSNRFIGLT